MHLPADLEQFVESQIAAAVFPSREALVEEAVRRMCDRVTRYEELKRSIQQADEQIDRGECYEIEGEEELRKCFDDLVAECDAAAMRTAS